MERRNRTAYSKQYYALHKQERNAYRTQWGQRNKKKLSAYRKAYYADNKEHISKRMKAWRQSNKPHVVKYDKQRRWNAKLEILNAYGNKCAHCGNNNPYQLEIDHINNDGAQHRRQLGSNRAGIGFYLLLRKWNYPKENFQLLCANCHNGKSYYGFFPDALIPECSQQVINALN